MGISTIRGILVVGIAALVLAGCASEKQDQGAMQPAAQAPEDMTASQPAQETAPAPEPEQIKPMKTDRGTLIVPTMDNQTEELQGVFYFDFDQAIVKRSAFDELNKHAQALKDDPSLHVRLEGNADERGTREYNLALGERRANAVKAYLVAQGVSPSQIEVISYGEEKPAVPGHNEEAWAKNRRVRIVYK